MTSKGYRVPIDRIEFDESVMAYFNIEYNDIESIYIESKWVE